jgi:BMFP domain-containing protein YqiC
MSAVAQILGQVEEFVKELLTGRDKRLDDLEARVAKLEAAGKSPAAAKTATASARTASASGKANQPK